MADTNTTKKSFLDLTGLQTLWTKMKNTFASQSSVDAITGQISDINTQIETLDSEIDGVQSLTLTYAPKEADNYTAALSTAKTAPAGTVIIVKESETIDDVTYNEGFYIVDTDKSVKYIGTSSGNTDADDLANRISNLENNIITASNIVDENGNTLGGFTIANNTLIAVYDNAVVANSESVNALTHRAIAAKFAEVEGTISAIPKFSIQVVDELPTSYSTSTIYLVKNSDSTSNNLYTEYIYIYDSNNSENSHWEKLGEQTITLDDYVTKSYLTTQINTALADYIKSSDVETLISTAKQDVLNTVAETYATKTELETATASFLTEDEIIASIQTGAIGEAIYITDDEINSLS